MANQLFQPGDPVMCGTCGVKAVVIGVLSFADDECYMLDCGDRNGYCKSCQQLVPDASITTDQIRAVCPSCETIVPSFNTR